MLITFKHNCTYTGNGFDLEKGSPDETKDVPHSATVALLKCGAAVSVEECLSAEQVADNLIAAIKANRLKKRA